ncbi:MAG TPA: Na-translocating system protein MpsB, partial [Saprospiraceae bacterium]|nr:Na-translocating system protein MpsB [Saprospiraceae bacterium]
MANHHPTAGFDAEHVLHELQHYLPSQTPLKDFIHHNSLHAFQHLPFYEAIFQAAAIFGFRPTLSLNDYRKMYANGRIRADILDQIIRQHKGAQALPEWRKKALQDQYDAPAEPRVGRLRAHWKSAYRIDLDNLVHPLLFRILGSYLDQGIAVKHFPFEDRGLMEAVRMLESSSFTSFFKGKRAKSLLQSPQESSIERLLEMVVGDPAYYERYLFDQQFAHKGWSGMAATLETRQDSLLYAKKISLRDLITLELLLEIDALDQALGEGWLPLCQQAHPEPLELFAPEPDSEFHQVLMLWQDAFEWSYYDEVLAGVNMLSERKSGTGQSTDLNGSHPADKPPSFQGIFCIDEREDSLRRHIELVDPACETLGCPGFFGVEFYFQPEGGKFHEKL